MSAVPSDREERQLVNALRVPPHSIEAEQSVLGGILLVPEALSKISDWLQPEDFYSRVHRLIYATLCEMASKREPIDALTVGTRMESDGTAEQVGGAAYLVEVANATPSAANIVAYAEIIVERSRLRQAISIGTDLAGKAFDRAAQSDAIVADSIRELSKIQSSRLRGALKPSRELLRGWMQGLQEAYTRGEAMTGVPTPWGELNRLTHGLQAGDLIIIAARSNMGKTVAACQIAEHAALDHGIRSAIFSMEMPASKLLSRITASRGGIPHKHLLSPAGMGDADWARVTEISAQLYDAPLWIDDTPALTIEQVQGRARRAHMQAPIGLLIADHLHEFKLRGKTSADRAHELGEVAQGLKALGKEFNCPVVALAQLNRELLDRNDKHPIMSDLRASGDIEQKADLILFLHREDYYDKKTHLKGVVDMDIGKGRDIETGARIHLRNRFDVMRLDDWEGELPLPPVEEPKTRSGGFRKRTKQDPVAEAYAE